MDNNNSNSYPPKKESSADDLLKKLKNNIANAPINPVAEKEVKKPQEIKSEEKDINKIKEELKRKQTVSVDTESEFEPTKEIPKITENIKPAKSETLSDEDDIDVKALLERFAPETLPLNENKSEEKSDDTDVEPEVETDRYDQFTPKKKAPSIKNPDIEKRIKAAEAYATNMVDKVDEEVAEDPEPKPELDDLDLNLMIAFGMEDELAQTVGIEKVNEIESDIDKSFEHISDKTIQTGEMEKTGFEYTDISQTKEIFQNYKKVYRGILLRLLSCFLLLILTFFYENISLFGAVLPAPINPEIYPVVHILINLQFLVLASALIYKPLYNGMMSLFKFKPIPESVTFVILSITVVYHILLCFISIGPGVRLFNFPVVMSIFLTLIHEFMNLARELYGFNIASSKRTKYAVDLMNPNKSELECETFYEFLPQNPIMLKIKKSPFIDGFYKRISAYPKNKKILNVIIPVVIIVAAAFFVFTYFFKSDNDLQASIQIAYMTLIICTPFSLFVTYSYPFYKASKDAYENDSAIIGEASLEQYSSASAISFEDKEVFPSYGVKMKSVKVYGNNRIDQVIYYASSLFNLLGGPLSDVFDIATLELGHTEKVELIEVADDGIEAMVGETHILVGKASYMRRNEYDPVNPEEDGRIEDGGEVSVMYMTVGSEVAAKMYIQYVIDPDFEFIIRQLYKAGMCVGIKTFDPNINDSMLSARIRLNKYPVKIIRCRGLDDQIETEDHIESGIISKNSPKSLLQTLALCDKVLQAIKTNLVVKIFAMLISVIIMVLLLMLDMSGDVNSFYIALYQLFWSIPMVIIARLFI